MTDFLLAGGHAGAALGADRAGGRFRTADRRLGHAVIDRLAGAGPAAARSAAVVLSSLAWAEGCTAQALHWGRRAVDQPLPPVPAGDGAYPGWHWRPSSSRWAGLRRRRNCSGRCRRRATTPFTGRPWTWCGRRGCGPGTWTPPDGGRGTRGRPRPTADCRASRPGRGPRCAAPTSSRTTRGRRPGISPAAGDTGRAPARSVDHPRPRGPDDPRRRRGPPVAARPRPATRRR